MNTKYKIIILSIGLFSVLSASVLAAPGDLNLGFGNGGIVTTPFTSDRDEFSSIVVQPDGKIVVSGYSWAYSIYDLDEYPSGGFISRYNSSGTLDVSFGAGGKILTYISVAGSYYAYAGTRTILQSDGKIVSIGERWNSAGNPALLDFAVFRYNADGTPDASFGAGGKVFTDFQTTYDQTRDVVLQPDGKIVVAGNSLANDSFIAARYNADGSLDSSFGAGGKVITPVGNNGRANSILLQPDGKTVLIGFRSNGSNDDIILVRYNTDGSLDSTFGANGRAIHNTGGHEGAYDAVLQPDGKIVVTGFGYTGYEGGGKTIIVRYHTNGSVDTSFAASGIFRTELGFYTGNGIAVQPDGKIISIGYSYIFSANTYDLAALRLLPTGAPDPNFGTNGKVITPIGVNSSLGAAIAVQADGKILASGGTFTVGAGTGDAAIIRYQGDAVVVAPRRTPFDFDGDGRADISVFRPSDRVWYLNHSTQGFSSTQFGLSNDKITPADYDGDGRTDIAVFRDGVWYLLRSAEGFSARHFGSSGDIPLPADFTGDGRSELVVYRGGNWYTLDLQTNQFNAVQFGLPTDKPVVGDFDGDSLADFAVYRDGIWYLLTSQQGFAAIQFGLATDKLVPADYDGDGKTDLAVYRDGIWYLLGSQSGFTGFQFGISSNVPAPADYDGDGRADAAVYRGGDWFLRQSANGFSAQQFGLANDKPVPAVYLP